MSNFSYKAIDENGMAVSGVVDADSTVMVENVLTARGYIPTKIKEVSTASFLDIWHKINAKTGAVKIPELIIFTKQLRSLLRAGISIVRLLKVIELQTQNRTLRRIANIISRKVKQGMSLADCVDEHPAVFSPLYRAMIRAGEISGSLPEVLKRLVFILDHEKKVKAEIVSAIRYPILVLFTLAAAFFTLLTYVIPKFATMFEKANIDLPLPTRIALGLYNLLSDYWHILIVAAFTLIVGLVFFLRTEEGKYIKDSILLKIPVIGPLFVKTAMARFASIFAILHASGINILETMTILSGTIGNTAISRTFDDIRERVKEGEGIANPLKSARHFPPMVVDMVAIGEESGNLEEMLRDITEHYDDEVEYQVKGLEGYIGPVLIVMLAAVVGFFALAIFMPVWEMSKIAKY